jgi:hypothetical protein
MAVNRSALGDKCTQKADDGRQNIGRPVRLRVCVGNSQGRLVGVTKALGNAGQEQRPAGNCLEMPRGRFSMARDRLHQL